MWCPPRLHLVAHASAYLSVSLCRRFCLVLSVSACLRACIRPSGVDLFTCSVCCSCTLSLRACAYLCACQSDPERKSRLSTAPRYVQTCLIFTTRQTACRSPTTAPVVVSSCCSWPTTTPASRIFLPAYPGHPDSRAWTGVILGLDTPCSFCPLSAVPSRVFGVTGARQVA